VPRWPCSTACSFSLAAYPLAIFAIDQPTMLTADRSLDPYGAATDRWKGRLVIARRRSGDVLVVGRKDGRDGVHMREHPVQFAHSILPFGCRQAMPCR